MAIGNFQGRAVTSATNPRAKGECDCCGFWYPLHKLQAQSAWAGTQLIDTGDLVCPGCLSVPQQQNRSIRLPGDPRPRTNPRPGRDAANAAIGGSNNRASSTGVVSDTNTLASGT